MQIIPDNYDLFESHERQLERRLKRLPICNRCGDRITSEYAYDVDGLWCEKCFEIFTKEIRVDMLFYEEEQE